MLANMESYFTSLDWFSLKISVNGFSRILKNATKLVGVAPKVGGV